MPEKTLNESKPETVPCVECGDPIRVEDPRYLSSPPLCSHECAREYYDTEREL